jgi:hypothetical protein
LKGLKPENFANRVLHYLSWASEHTPNVVLVEGGRDYSFFKKRLATSVKLWNVQGSTNVYEVLRYCHHKNTNVFGIVDGDYEWIRRTMECHKSIRILDENNLESLVVFTPEVKQEVSILMQIELFEYALECARVLGYLRGINHLTGNSWRFKPSSDERSPVRLEIINSLLSNQDNMDKVRFKSDLVELFDYDFDELEQNITRIKEMDLYSEKQLVNGKDLIYFVAKLINRNEDKLFDKFDRAHGQTKYLQTAIFQDIVNLGLEVRPKYYPK